MHPDLPIGRNAAPESTGGVKSSVGESRRAAAATSSDPAPNVESGPGAPRSWALRVQQARLLVRAQLRCDLQQERERARDVRRRE